jgi:diguanylate cyclase (GGDEF)-like protein
MTNPRTGSRPPIVLIANSQEWHARSLESVLSPQGYAVLRAYTGKQALERATEARPDAIILDSDLPDIDGFEICRQLRAHSAISDSTPILMTSPGHPSRQRRLEALRAGAWDYIGASVDGEELPLRLGVLVRAKQDADRTREDGLLDELTGLYNVRGIARRAREIGSQAFRSKDALAVLVLSPYGTTAQQSVGAGVLEQVAHILRDTGRISDAIGTLGPQEFAIVAQGTDDAGAVRLAERIVQAIAPVLAPYGIELSIGFDAVSNYGESPIDPGDMLNRASAAMRRWSADQATSRTAPRIYRSQVELN